jgi:hypothetical protein
MILSGKGRWKRNNPYNYYEQQLWMSDMGSRFQKSQKAKWTRGFNREKMMITLPSSKGLNKSWLSFRVYIGSSSVNSLSYQVHFFLKKKILNY